MGCGTTGMHNTLGDALVVKAMKFLATNLILKQHWAIVFTARIDHSEPGIHANQTTCRSRLACHAPIVCIGNPDAMICSQMLARLRLLDVTLQVSDLVCGSHRGKSFLRRFCKR